MSVSVTGHCLCGAVSYSAEIQPEVHPCHCEMCRRWSGGPGMALYADSISYEGEDQLGIYESSNFAERGFCKTCGSNLFYRVKESQLTVLWSGAIDDPSVLKLEGEIYIDAKPDFYDFVGDHPRLTEAQFLEQIKAMN